MLRRVLHTSALESPLGRLTLAASIEGGRGIVPAQPLRIYGSYALVYITRGRGRYRDANGTAQAIEAGDLIMVFPELAHTYGPRPGETWSELYLVFDGPVFEAWRSIGMLSSRRPVYRLLPIDNWVERFRWVIGQETIDTVDAKALQICRLLTLLTEIATRHEAVARPIDEHHWATKACALLGEDLNADRSMEEFARKVGMSGQSFRKRFKEELGVSPARYRANRRIETACDLLQYTGMTNAQIAESVGFSDEYHFSKRFKGLRGESPREFRRRHLR